MTQCCSFTTLILTLVVTGTALGGPALAERVFTKGKLKGVVVDHQEARITGTQVRIRSSEFKADLKTNEAGEFESEVPVGVYEVSVESAGFKKFHRKGVKVEPSKTTPMKIKLKSAPTRIKMARDGIYL